MSDQVPFFLREAVISLYPAGSDGQALTGAAVWSGALATGLRLGLNYEVMKVLGAGERYATEHHLDEEHVIQIDRTWILRRGQADFRPGRNQTYVLDIVWAETPGPGPANWHRKTYFGVTGRSAALQSLGTNQFGSNQVWRAQSLTEQSGAITRGGGGAPIYTPLPAPTSGATQAVGFFREDPLVVGDYLLGQYRWPMAVKLGSATAIAWAGQGVDTVLGLELDGVLTGSTVTLVAGVANTEVSQTVDLSAVTVGAGQTVRWKVVSGPGDVVTAAWALALTMQVTPQ